MSKKSTDQKTEKQTEAKKPVDLQEEELEVVQAGTHRPSDGKVYLRNSNTPGIA